MDRNSPLRLPCFPYHVTLRSQHTDWFSLPTKEAWAIFGNIIEKITISYQTRVHVLVLMSNHLHALISTPRRNLNDVMLYLFKESYRSMNQTPESINQVSRVPYTSSAITNPFYYGLAYKYVFRNPIKAGMARQVENYPYSTIRAEFFGDPLPFSLEASRFDFHLPSGLNLKARLEWLNRPFALEEEGFVRAGLHRETFEIKTRQDDPANAAYVFGSRWKFMKSGRPL